jgi:hypothetical protein
MEQGEKPLPKKTQTSLILPNVVIQIIHLLHSIGSLGPQTLQRCSHLDERVSDRQAIVTPGVGQGQLGGVGRW